MVIFILSETSKLDFRTIVSSAKTSHDLMRYCALLREKPKWFERYWSSLIVTKIQKFARLHWGECYFQVFRILRLRNVKVPSLQPPSVDDARCQFLDEQSL